MGVDPYLDRFDDGHYRGGSPGAALEVGDWHHKQGNQPAFLEAGEDKQRRLDQYPGRQCDRDKLHCLFRIGTVFLFGGEGHGAIATPEFLFDRQTWDFIHAWSGVMFIVSAVVHLMIHWTWVTKVSRKIFLRKTFREFGEI